MPEIVSGFVGVGCVQARWVLALLVPLSQSDAGTSAVLIDELDASDF
jgi:hypothetical protein